MTTCLEFLYGSLNDLDEETQERVVTALHDSSSTVEDNLKIFEEIMTDIEKQNVIDTFTGHCVSLKFAYLINKKENKEAAISFLKRKLERMGRDEFHTLIAMSSIYDKNGDYGEAIQTLDRAKKIISEESKEDKLKYAVLMLKFAADYWNYESKSAKAYEYQRKGMDLLNELNPQFLEIKTPSSETGMTFIDAYKTAAYVYRIQNDYRNSLLCYEKAYDIVKKCPYSKLHHLKGLSQVCVSKSKIQTYNNVPTLVADLMDEAIEIGDEISSNDEFMKAHVDSIIHVFSRLAHTNSVLKDRERSLAIRLKSMDLLKQYQGEDHPEVARISADIAFNYYIIRDRDKCDKYVDLAEDILSSCGYKEDILKAKLYFREISDTLHILGNLFTIMNEYGNAEEYYKRSLELHMKVFGENHQRISKIYRYLGSLYSRWGKKELSLEWYTKAIDVSTLYLPASQNIIDKIKMEMERANTPRNPRVRSNRGKNYR